MRSFKSAVTRQVRLKNLILGAVWQRNYYDRVIRNEAELNRIREYIANNPVAWRYDHENPHRVENIAHQADWSWLEEGAV